MVFLLVKKPYISKIQDGTHSNSGYTVPEMGPPHSTVDSFCVLYNKSEESLRKLKLKPRLYFSWLP